MAQGHLPDPEYAADVRTLRVLAVGGAALAALGAGIALIVGAGARTGPAAVHVVIALVACVAAIQLWRLQGWAAWALVGTSAWGTVAALFSLETWTALAIVFAFFHFLVVTELSMVSLTTDAFQRARAGDFPSAAGTPVTKLS